MKIKKIDVFIVFVVLTIPLFVTAQQFDLQSFNGLRRDIQKVFAEEVSSKKNISSVSQTARLLALMEFMEPSGYSEFFGCLKKYPTWEDLNATKREQVVDACGRVAKGAQIKVIGPAPSSITSSEAISSESSETFDRKLTDIQNRLKEIDRRVSAVQELQKTMQETLLINRSPTPRRPASNEAPIEEDIY